MAGTGDERMTCQPTYNAPLPGIVTRNTLAVHIPAPGVPVWTLR